MSCPMGYGKTSLDKEEDMMGDINPRNMMPSNLQDLPTPEGTPDLDKTRSMSSIPKTGESVNWEYPSPHQFYNAMLRRNKDPEADMMDAVVYIHNVVNEETWSKVLEREQMYDSSCPIPSLNRFVGKYDEPSIKSRFQQFKYGKPFDRHDWFVDRCGKNVRYIVDYYGGGDNNSEDMSFDKVTRQGVYIDARPACFDSFENFIDVIRFPLWRWWKTL